METDVPKVVTKTPKSSKSPPGSSKKKSGSPKGKQGDRKSPSRANKLVSAASTDHEVAVVSPVNIPGYPKLNEDGELPEGILPLFLTTKTQEIFKCRRGEELTEENLYKLISKADILEDFKLRAGISDFHPFKEQILGYNGEEILIGSDPNFVFGQNFFIVFSEEEKEKILFPKEEVEELAEEEVIYKWIPPVPKDWISFGSEKEIYDTTVYNSRPLLSTQIQRLRKSFGAPITLADQIYKKGKDGYEECISEEEWPEPVVTMQLEKATQAIFECKSSETQTTWKYPKNANTQYYPREMTDGESQDVLASQPVTSFINDVSYRLEQSLQQNEIMNIFHNDWLNLGHSEDAIIGSKADSHLKEYQSFTDLKYSKSKSVSMIEWHPSIKGIVAVAAVDKHNFDDFIDHSSKHILNPSVILLWSFMDPINPQLLLEAPSDIHCFKFSPTNHNFVAGGCVNGQVVLWDITEHEDKLRQLRTSTKSKKSKSMTRFGDESVAKIPVSRYCAVSGIEHGHRSPITDISWIPCHMEINRVGVPCECNMNDCCQLMTCANDHHIYVWDMRVSKAIMEKSRNYKNAMGIPPTFKHLDLMWKPLLKVTTFKADTGGYNYPTKFSIEEQHKERDPNIDQPDVDPDSGVYITVETSYKKKALENIKTSFYVGTEDGVLMYVDWMPHKDSETGKVITPRPQYQHSLHDGPIVTLSRSPFFNDVLLCIGGWKFTIWKEGVSSGPLLTSASASSRLTCAHWSPTRPAVFYVARFDGSIDVWDLIDHTHEPTLKQSISATALTAIHPYQFSSKQQLLAVGDGSGTLHVLEIPWSLKQPASNELSLVSEYFDREVKRRTFVVNRWNIREEEKRNIELEAQRKAGIAPQIILNAEEIYQKEKMEYEEYLKEEQSFLRALGIRDDDEEFIAEEQ